MTRKLAIIQSNYIPWKGYFDIINMVDDFILLDDVQYTRRDWRNRNLIKTPGGLQWLTIDVETKGKYFQRIRETRVAHREWAKEHWAALKHNYAKAACFKDYQDFLEALYLQAGDLEYLSEINQLFITAICKLLDIRTRISRSMDYQPLPEGKTERLIALCKAVGAKVYLSGPAARDYIDESRFVSEGIDVTYMDYAGYPEYPQLHGAFEHGVSILDLILNTGSNATTYMKSFSKG